MAFVKSRQRPLIRLSRDGPYLVTIDDLVNSKGERLDGSLGVALCRCGASRSKPICDSSHIRIGFSAPKPSTRPDQARAQAGDLSGPDEVNPPSILIRRNGPYEVRGCDLDVATWPEGVSRE